MTSPTLGFSLGRSDQERVQRLAVRYAHGNRSAWLRQALDLFEERALFETLAGVQAHGERATAARGIDRALLQDLVASSAANPDTRHAERVSALLGDADIEAAPAGRDAVDAFLEATNRAATSP